MTVVVGITSLPGPSVPGPPDPGPSLPGPLQSIPILTMNNGFLMLKCLSLRSDQKYNSLVSACSPNLCLFLQQSFCNQHIFCGAVNNVIAVEYNNVFPVMLYKFCFFINVLVTVT